MSAPLPEILTKSVSCGEAGHAGLWFDKFCNTWTPEWKLDSPAKLKWIQTVASAEKRVGSAALLKEHASRLASLTKALGGRAAFFKTNGRFATGLGREHPIENGFAWHPTLGAPYLPGSSVKGLVRAWARVLLENGNVDAATERRIFGGERSEHVGSVIFFDAIPIKPVQLEADVMTPHYGPYYQGKKDDNGQPHPPADWHSPKPIPFLTVSSGQSFLFGIAPRTSSDADRQDCEKVAQWLPEALQTLGAGAKAAVGYGRFVPDPESAEAAKKADEEAAKKAQEAAEQAAFVASLANLSPIARELRQAAHAGRWETDANAFKSAGVREKWMERLEADPQPDAVAYFGELIEKHDPGILANPDRKKGKKQESAYKESSIKITKRWLALPKQ